MYLFRWAVLILLFFCSPGVSSSIAGDDFTATPDDILGIWETAHDDENWSRVEIFKLGDLYHGKIVFLNSPFYPEGSTDGPAGQPRTDRNNPEESLRSRPALGLELMHSFRFDDGKWKGGRIYDPTNGKDYRCKLTLKGRDTLEVFGYVKVGFLKLGRNTTWKRHPDQ